MSHYDEILAFKAEKENEDAQDGQHLESNQLSTAEMGMAELPSSTNDTIHFEDNLEEVAAVSDANSPQYSFVLPRNFPVTMTEMLDSHPEKGSASSQEDKELDGREEPAQVGASLLEALYDKMSDLVGFLLLKYRTKQLTTKDEMLKTILDNDEENFSFILSQVSECMQVVFGIDVKEVDPQAHSYVLVTTLGLTYDGMVDSQQTMPTTGLLVMVLGVILLEDNCASEEVIWEQLGLMGVHPGREHFICLKPRELLTNVWVQEQYLDYQREPGSYPARYQFLWGPRAHAEISKVKVMEFLLSIYNSHNRSLLFLTDGPHYKDRNEEA